MNTEPGRVSKRESYPPGTDTYELTRMKHVYIYVVSEGLMLSRRERVHLEGG